MKNGLRNTERLTCRCADMAKQKTTREGFIASVEKTYEGASWSNPLDMGRFLILVFLTADEKRAFAEAQLGDASLDYIDGDDVEKLVKKVR